MPDRTTQETLDGFVDRVERSAHEWRADGALPGDLFRALGATGFFEQRWAQGRRGGVPDALDLIRRVAPFDGGLALAISLHSEVFLSTLSRFRSNQRAASVFAAGLSGKAVGALAITEDHSGSDPSSVRTRARRADGGWRLTGSKRYISNLENATHCLVLADVVDEARGGPTVFLVDRRLGGYELAGRYGKLGTDSVGAWRLELDAHVDDGARLGPTGSGLAVLLGALRYERMAVAAAVLAGARHALELSVAFLRQRPQGDRRLYDVSALSHRAAASWAQLEASSALFDRLVERDRSGAAVDSDYAAVKYHAAGTAQEVTDTALQLLGGRGYTDAFPHERILRDIRLARIGAGTDEMMLEVIGRHLDTSSPETSGRLARHLAEDLPNR